MRRDRIKWNDKHLKRDPIITPSRIVTTHYHLSPKGRALDIATGTGRNAIFLAQRGFSVEAVDISDVALKPLGGLYPNLHLICADLDTFKIPANRYSLICNIRFLDRRLFPLIIDGLVTGGVLIFESYLEEPQKKGAGPIRREYLLNKNELRRAFAALQVVYYGEKAAPGRRHHGRVASLVAINKR